MPPPLFVSVSVSVSVSVCLSVSVYLSLTHTLSLSLSLSLSVCLSLCLSPSLSLCLSLSPLSLYLSIPPPPLAPMCRLNVPANLLICRARRAHQGAYLGDWPDGFVDWWNVMDLVVILLGFVSLIPGSNNFQVLHGSCCHYLRLLSNDEGFTRRPCKLERTSRALDMRGSALTSQVLRTLRLLRPLASISTSSSMRVLIKALYGSLAQLVDVLLLCSFLYLMYGIIGVQIWMGTFRNHCVHDVTGDVLDVDVVCGVCPDSYTCRVRPIGPELPLCVCSRLKQHKTESRLATTAYYLLPTIPTAYYTYCLLPTTYYCTYYILPTIPTAYYLLPITYYTYYLLYLLPTTYYLLPTTYYTYYTYCLQYCLLPTAHCLLPTTYYLLPTIHTTYYLLQYCVEGPPPPPPPPPEGFDICLLQIETTQRESRLMSIATCFCTPCRTHFWTTSPRFRIQTMASTASTTLDTRAWLSSRLCSPRDGCRSKATR